MGGFALILFNCLFINLLSVDACVIIEFQGVVF